MTSQNIYFQSFAGYNIYFHPISAQTIYFKIEIFKDFNLMDAGLFTYFPRDPGLAYVFQGV